MSLLSGTVFLLSAFLSPMSAQTEDTAIIGLAEVIDGDSIKIDGLEIRLLGIDAVEAAQICQRDGSAWQCGAEAKAILADFVDGQKISCSAHGLDIYKRTLATCYSGL